MEKYDKISRTGPMLYAHLLEQLTSSSPDAIRKVTQNIVDLKLDKFEGESIPMVCKSIRACFKWLDMVHKMPIDPETIVVNILETCTVPEYLRYLETLKVHAELNPNVQLSVDYLLTKSEEKYRELVLMSKWDISASGATFNLSRTPDRPRTSERTQGAPTRKSLFTKPKEGESEVKVILGEDYKFCGKCHRWNKGSRAHTTSEHVVGMRSTEGRGTPSTEGRGTTSDTESVQSEATDNGKTRHPSAQSYHFRHVTFIGGI
jgi:hypothetical protein